MGPIPEFRVVQRRGTMAMSNYELHRHTLRYRSQVGTHSFSWDVEEEEGEGTWNSEDNSPAFVLMAIALQLCRGLSIGTIDKDNAATRLRLKPVLSCRAALTKKAYPPTPTPSHTTTIPSCPLPLPPPRALPPRFCAAPPHLFRELCFFHHLCMSHCISIDLHKIGCT